MANKAAVFFLSTGRCGTQWFEKALAEVYSDRAVVTHEPVKADYEPRKFLRAYDDLHLLLDNPAVSEHLRSIRGTLPKYIYIETGWPCYPAIPLFIEKLEKVKVVHVVRHPVRVALSLATHKVYSRTDWISNAALTPHDHGVVNRADWRDWEELTTFEKCLFWWTEINAYALEVRSIFDAAQYHFVRFEDIFANEGSALEELTDFIGLPYRHVLGKRKAKCVDTFKYTTEAVDWRLIDKYPGTLSLMDRFGYSSSDYNSGAIKRRYFSPLGSVVKDSLGKMIRRVDLLRGRI
ncbi:MAG: sulfotransferase domain-containing protein [Anaerolineae bacterium]